MNNNIQFPLTLRMKLLALAPQFYVQNADGKQIAYIKQKLLKLKEAITIYASEEQQQVLYTIKADRVIDFGARYDFADATGQAIGAVKQSGVRSLWRAHFEVLDGDTACFDIQEERVWVRMLDNLLSEVPFIGPLSGYLLNPSYMVSRKDGSLVARMKKQPAFWEGVFHIEALGALNAKEQQQLMLALFMTVLLERQRG